MCSSGLAPRSLSLSMLNLFQFLAAILLLSLTNPTSAIAIPVANPSPADDPGHFRPNSPPPKFIVPPIPKDPMSINFKWFHGQLNRPLPLERDKCVFYCKETDRARDWAKKHGLFTIWESYPNYIFSPNGPGTAWRAADKFMEYVVESSRAYAAECVGHVWLVVDEAKQFRGDRPDEKCIWESTEWPRLKEDGRVTQITKVDLVQTYTEETELDEASRDPDYWPPGEERPCATVTGKSKKRGGSCSQPGKCPSGLANVGKNKECQACGKGQKPDDKGEKCVPEKAMTPEISDKIARTQNCYAFAMVNQPLNAFNMTDLEDKAREDGMNWDPKITWVPGELSVSNWSPATKPVPYIALPSRKRLSRRGGGPLNAIIGWFATGVDLVKNGAELIEDPANPEAWLKLGKDAADLLGVHGSSQKPAPTQGPPALAPPYKSKESLDAIAKILKDPVVKKCLAYEQGSFTFEGTQSYHLNGLIPEGGFKADKTDKILSLELCSDKNCNKNAPLMVWTTYTTPTYRPNWLIDDRCIGLPTGYPGLGSDSTTAYKVSGGCCTFYDDLSCGIPLFLATDREDMRMDLHGNNDKISSFKCTHSPTC